MNILSNTVTQQINSQLSTKLSLASDDKKIRIMAATVQLVAQNGIHAIPMSQVGKLANVSAGAIYHHYDSKETIIRETYLSLKQAHINIMMQYDNETSDYRTRFLNFWQMIFQCFLVKGHFSFIEQCAMSPLIDEDTSQRAMLIAKPIADFFIQGITDKHLNEIPHHLLFHLIFSSISSAVKIQLDEKTPALTKQEVLQAANFCWNGLKSQ